MSMNMSMATATTEGSPVAAGLTDTDTETRGIRTTSRIGKLGRISPFAILAVITFQPLLGVIPCSAFGPFLGSDTSVHVLGY